jgi:fumarate reductase (CoM/CoB) subunit A
VSTPTLPWRVERVDVLVAGSGGAGMRAAIEARRRGLDVAVVAKGPARASHTRMSGGRFNAISGQNPKDSADIFFKDTIAGGAGINNQELVQILVNEAMARAYDLESWGLIWERDTATRYLITGSGGGTRLRMLGSYDEGIGITEVMLNELRRLGTPIREYQMLVDVAQDATGRVSGGLVLDLRRGEWVFYDCAAAIIATGGASQLYETNSGPAFNTGDGIAIAYRAGAELVDIEFMQFIPIAFVYPQSIRGYTLTEPQYYGERHFNVDGEPGKLLNNRGERFVLKHDPVRREGGTRDILARAIMLEILEGRGTPEGGVWLEPDPRIFEAFLRERPIYVKRILENYGEKAARFQEAFQVMPSALYTTGGIRIDGWGRTTVPGLYAAGEAAGGVHGANRLGASSMPDIQVFGRRAGMAAAEDVRERAGRGPADTLWARQRAAALDGLLGHEHGMRPSHVRKRVQQLAWTNLGLIRHRDGLEEALTVLADIREAADRGLQVTGRTRTLNREWMEAIELNNMLDVASALAATALTRAETRGAHYRQDYPDRNDAEWLVNLYVRRDGNRARVERREVVTLATAPPQSSIHASERT